MNNVTDIKTGLPVVAGVEIAVDEHGRFNLNALHKAHIAANPELHRNSKQPADWMKLESVKSLDRTKFLTPKILALRQSRPRWGDMAAPLPMNSWQFLTPDGSAPHSS